MKEYINTKNLKNIKAIIFDFDETLYHNKSRQSYLNYLKTAVMTLGHKTEEESSCLLTELGFTFDNPNSPSFTKSCEHFGFTQDDWNKFRVDNYLPIALDADVIDNNLIAELSRHFQLFIVSNEVYKNIEEKAQKMGLNLLYFKKIYGVSEKQLFAGRNLAKKDAYAHILSSNNLEAKDVLGVGDRYNVDLKPLIDLGGNGLEIQNPKEFESFAKSNLLKKRALLFTITIGAGHNQVAKNISQSLEKNGYETLIVDMFSNSKIIGGFVTNNLKVMSKFPHIANFFYDDCKKRNKNPFNVLIKRVKKEMLEIVNGYKPDVIVSSHIAGYLFVQEYGNMFEKNVLNYFICTDYDLPPYVNPEKSKNKSFAIVPNKDFVEELLPLGWKIENILPFGIPIDEKFFDDVTKEQACQILGIQNCNKPTILFAGGGLGIGKIFKAVSELSQNGNLQLISIAGKNKKLKEKIDNLAKKSKAKIYSVGFTDKIELYLSASDVVVGKTGGLTSTEAIAKQKPMITFGMLANPEFANMLYLSGKGVATNVDGTEELKKVCTKENIEAMCQKFKDFKVSNATKAIVQHIKNNVK